MELSSTVLAEKVWSDFPAQRSDQLAAQIVFYAACPVQHGLYGKDTLRLLIDAEIQFVLLL